MKKYILLISIFLTSFLFSQEKWEDIKITKNSDLIKDLTPYETVEATRSFPFGSRIDMKRKAEIKLKKQAFKMGCSIVFLESDEFSFTPINQVYLKGTCYRKSSTEKK